MALADLHAVEADVINDDAVMYALHVQAEDAAIAQAHGENPGLHGLAGSAGDFEMFGFIFDLALDSF